MYIFYDLETTGTDVVFDQILQFGAVLVDENLIERDRIECRCRLLPWVVPSPSALLVTSTNVRLLDDPSLPDFFTMMQNVAKRLEQWGAAIFVGYNSMRFDEPLLQRAFWQALLPPYVTVTGGNSRFDLLPLIRAASLLRPGFFTVPRRETGKASFKLDALAPANGFTAHHAHDALGDVEATLFLAKKLKTGLPELWEPLASRTSKASVTSLLAPESPIFFLDHGATSTFASFMRIDRALSRQSHAILARLEFDWAGAGKPSKDNSTKMRKALRRIPLNKAPVLLTSQEIQLLSHLAPSTEELEQAAFLSSNPEHCLALAELMEPLETAQTGEEAQLEEMIFEDFATPHDANLMTQFHRSSFSQKSVVAQSFDDLRFRRLAIRMLFVQHPSSLGDRDKLNIRSGISNRLEGDPEGKHRYRSISDALRELNAASQSFASHQTDPIRDWLANRTAVTR
ncbi:exonuclease domain-containing protein [Pseudoblastomonas halimionae]|uniref:ExoI C-terminal domain-containing protein n=1 Tax=Alteriqipengyuania halimionae TaxID=1926630 RepID=A0A6I4U3Y4_9SPHN|nr:exonuclease domain-containing protein [Alteriqipengyuania halimionae]MXP09625.1 hypothetical protein [Alteriqipengyuania halimionae]